MSEHDDHTAIPVDQPRDWLNDQTDYQQCFVCGQRNPFGLHLHFQSEGERVITEFTGDERHQSFPGIIHGGIQAAMLDETMGRITVLEHRWVMTARLELRYRAPARINVPLRIQAEATLIRPRIVKVHGWICEVAHPEIICCEADGTFMPLADSVRDQAISDFPGLGSFF